MNRNQADISTLSVKTFGRWAAIGYSIKSGAIDVYVAEDPSINVKASRVAERAIPGHAPHADVTPGNGGRPIPFFFPGDKVPHFRCPPGTRRGGKWTDKLGSDCELSGSRAALSRIGQRLDRISRGERGRGNLPTISQRSTYTARRTADRLDYADPLNRVSPRRVRRNREGFNTPSPEGARRLAGRLDFNDPENIARARRGRRNGQAERTVRRTRQTEAETSKFRTPSPRGARNLADRLDYADPENIARTEKRRARRVERSKERVQRREQRAADRARRAEERSQSREARARRTATRLDYNDPENIARTEQRRARRVQRSKERTQRREARSQSREARARRTAGRLDYNDPENMAPSNRRRQGRLPAPEQTRVREPKPEAPKKPRATALETTVEDAANRPGAAKPKKPAPSTPSNSLSKADREEAHRRASDGFTKFDRQDIESFATREQKIKRAEALAKEHERRAAIANRRAWDYHNVDNTESARAMAQAAESLRERARLAREYRDGLKKNRTEPKTAVDLLTPAQHRQAKDGADVDIRLATNGLPDYETDEQRLRHLDDQIAVYQRRQKTHMEIAERYRKDGDLERSADYAVVAESHRMVAEELTKRRERIAKNNATRSERDAQTTNAVKDLMTDAQLESARREAVREYNPIARAIEYRGGEDGHDYATQEIRRRERRLAQREEQMRNALAAGDRDNARSYAHYAEMEREVLRLLRERQASMPQPSPLPKELVTRIEKAVKPGADGELRHSVLEELAQHGTRAGDVEAGRIIQQMVDEIYVAEGKTGKGHKYTVEARMSHYRNGQSGYSASVSVVMRNANGIQVNTHGSRTLVFGAEDTREVYHAHFVIARRYRGKGYGGDYIRSTIWNAREQRMRMVHTSAASQADNSYTGVRTWPRLGFEPDHGVRISSPSARRRIEAALGKDQSQITGQDIRDNFELFSGIDAGSHMTLWLKDLPPREEYVRGKSLDADVEEKAMKKKRTYVDKKKTPIKRYTASWDEWVKILDEEWPEESEGKMPENELPKLGKKIDMPKEDASKKDKKK